MKLDKDWIERKQLLEDTLCAQDLPYERKDIFIFGKPIKILEREKAILNSGLIKSPHLDAGCHQGRLALRLVQEGYDVYALDASIVAIKTVKINAEKMNLKITACDGLVQNIPWEANYFESITCCETLEHCESPGLLNMAIKELGRVLKPGGWLIITVPIGKHHNHWSHHFHWDTEEELKEVLLHPGATNWKIEKISSSLNDIEQGIKGVFYITQRKTR